MSHLTKMNFSTSISPFLSSLLSKSLCRYFHFNVPLSFAHFTPAICGASMHYVFVLCFPFLLQQCHSSLLGSLSTEIKSLYYSTMTDNNEYFCLLIVIIKFIRFFIHTKYSLIDFDMTLESHVFVILVQATVGLAVTPQSYSFILKKYLSRVLLPTARRKRMTVKNRGGVLGRESIISLFGRRYSEYSVEGFKRELKNTLKVRVVEQKPFEKVNLREVMKEECMVLNRKQCGGGVGKQSCGGGVGKQQCGGVDVAQPFYSVGCSKVGKKEAKCSVKAQQSLFMTLKKGYKKEHSPQQSKQVSKHYLPSLKKQRSSNKNKTENSLFKISSEQISVALQSEFAKLGLERVYSNHNIVIKRKFKKIGSLTLREAAKVEAVECVKESAVVARVTKKDWSTLLHRVKADYERSRVGIERRK